MDLSPTEGNEFESMPAIRPTTLEEKLVQTGVVSRHGDAALLLSLFAFVISLMAIYLLIAAVPSHHALGADVLRQGETVPSYAH